MLFYCNLCWCIVTQLYPKWTQHWALLGQPPSPMFLEILSWKQNLNKINQKPMSKLQIIIKNSDSQLQKRIYLGKFWNCQEPEKWRIWQINQLCNMEYNNFKLEGHPPSTDSWVWGVQLNSVTAHCSVYGLVWFATRHQARFKQQHTHSCSPEWQ